MVCREGRGVLSEGEKIWRKKGVDWVFHQCLHIHTSIVVEGQSHVCIKDSVVARSASLNNQELWASVSEQTDSMPTTQSSKRKVRTISIWPLVRACFMRVERGEREGFWQLDGVEGSVMGRFFNNCQCLHINPFLSG